MVGVRESAGGASLGPALLGGNVLCACRGGRGFWKVKAAVGVAFEATGQAAVLEVIQRVIKKEQGGKEKVEAKQGGLRSGGAKRWGEPPFS